MGRILKDKKELALHRFGEKTFPLKYPEQKELGMFVQ